MIRELLGYMWMAAAFFGLPILIGRYGLGASWFDIGKAYAILAVICLFLGLTMKGETWEMKFTWAAILGMISVIPGVPLILVLMRFFGMR